MWVPTYKDVDGKWVPISSTGIISDGWIRDLNSIPAYTKNWLVSWSGDKELSSGVDAIGWNSLKKKKKEHIDGKNKGSNIS